MNSVSNFQWQRLAGGEKAGTSIALKLVFCVLLIFWLFTSSWTDVRLALIQLHATFFNGQNRRWDMVNCD